MDAAPAVRRADAMVRAIRSLSDAALRVAYVVDFLRTRQLPEVAATLEVVCARAEQAEEASREALIAIVDALNALGSEAVVQRLREEAVGESFLALERLVRNPIGGHRGSLLPADPNEDRVPDYGRGRPLTLGERKALARRPDRDTMQRLLRDPHPDVIRMLLGSGRVTEEDVVRLAAHRPCRPDVLSEIARAPRWAHRSRVRMSLVLNPDTPVEIAIGIAGLLMRQELRLVIEATQVSPAVRAICMEHLERRPPGERDDAEDDLPVH
jgi:hypothetical protein